MVVELEQYEKRIIVFIDILGFREHIKKTIEDKVSFTNLKDALNYISQIGSVINNELYEEHDKEITVFSDSIVISYPVANPNNVFSLLMDVVYIQLDMICRGILLRGGIATGELCHKNTIVYGPAMVEAYELESKSAIYPRVIISKDVFTIISKINNSTDLEIVNSLIKRDRDGQWYVDFLNQGHEFPPDEFLFALNKAKKLIENEINKNKARSNVQMKYEWLKSYFNEVVGEQSNLFIS